MEIFLHDYPGKQLRLELSAPELLLSQEALAKSAVEAIELFCKGLVLPCAFDLSLGYCDAEFAFPIDEFIPDHEYWFLALEKLPPRVVLSPAWVNAQEQKVKAITGDGLFNWICDAMDRVRSENSSTDDTVVVGWREIIMRSAQIQLPDDVVSQQESTLLLRTGGDQSIEYPVEYINGQSYVYGPLEEKSTISPLELRVTNDSESLTMDIHLFWSVWTDPHYKGFLQIRRAIERLEAAQWTCTYGLE